MLPVLVEQLASGPARVACGTSQWKNQQREYQREPVKNHKEQPTGDSGSKVP